MTTPTGTIGFNDVNTELGKSSTAQIGLNDSAVRSLAGKASGQIAFSDLRGKSATSVAAPNGTIAATNFGTAVAGFSLLSNGNTTTTQQGSGTDTVNNDDWYTPITTSIGSGYSVRVTLLSGINPSGPALGSWHVLSSTRYWSMSSGAGYRACSVRVEIRKGTGAVLATGTVNIQAEGGNV